MLAPKGKAHWLASKHALARASEGESEGTWKRVEGTEGSVLLEIGQHSLEYGLVRIVASHVLTNL